ncbi:MAG: hypothetical protein IPM29_22320 [Planctomycetes bacterium]|nr:hypothetical protein [Planctomycetota bacterium]
MKTRHRLPSALGGFVVVMTCACVVNFVAQIAMVFLDVLTRLESSSAAILALWFVTGVFTTVFTCGDLDEPSGDGRFRATVVLWLSCVAVVASIVAACLGWPGGDPLEFSLLFTNVWVVIACFLGAGVMASVLRLATAPSSRGGRERG